MKDNNSKLGCDIKERSNSCSVTPSCCSATASRDKSMDSCCGSSSSAKPEGRGNRLPINKIIILVISFVSLVLGYFNWHNIGVMVLYYVNPSWIAVILCGAPIFYNAGLALTRKKITAALLISIAILASIALEFIGFFASDHSSHGHSYIFAAGEIAFLMAVGAIIEDATIRKTRSGIDRLVNLIPKIANVKTDKGLLEKSLTDINIGDIVVAKAGEMIAVDGIISAGASSIDQSSVTGEYLPVDCKVGDSVYGGTFNQSGVIEITVTKLLKDMTVAKMAELVEEAEGRKAPISRIADKWASYIVPFAAVLSIIVGLIALYAFRTEWNVALIRAVTVLVVFCPCALALATPTAIAAGIGAAARKGVLVKSGQALEALSHVDTLCFDKTGTLTTGKIILDTIYTSDYSKEKFMRLMASVESYSEHPIGKAVVKAAEGINLSPPQVVITLQGIGIEAKVEGLSIKLYNYGYAKKSGLTTPDFDQFATMEMSGGKTVIAGIVEDKMVAAVSFSDTLRDNAKQIINDIREKGYNTIMLTGDNEASAKYIGERSGINIIKHSLLPADKQGIIADLQKEGKKVCMLGDGINDAPSLKLADCGIAMGALGNDLAIDTADMAILNSDIGKVKNVLSLSRRVLNTIKRNIVIAMSINLIAVVLSTFGILTPVSGAIVHNFTSILVVLSSALLLRNKGDKNNNTP